MNDDARLVKRLLAGETRAFEEAVNTYQSAMHAVAYAIVGSRGSEDVVQEAWLSVVRSLSGFQFRSSLKTWLLTITANLAKSHYKRNRREVLLDDVPSPHGTFDDDRFSPDDGHWLLAPYMWHEDTPEALLTENELRQCLEHTLQHLPQLQSGVLLLRDRQGLSLEEICILLDISLSNVRVLLHRARLKVFATVEHFEETGEC
ncbi:ECF RNA polymerase sigma-E factor [Pseudomonas fluorescens]|uniref:ECF RNA polymerase sigma-E factor n=1 Tax=Pseudomonas fluorescens TaxID=294 RepID=A0A5E6NZP4_PSEFL|nr:RNA polymerase sigma factor [Pseudomonas fluorescens]VVM36309.1 ECF RNA polymerase sigma-E factor [Pseudomonas fluorescens]